MPARDHRFVILAGAAVLVAVVAGFLLLTGVLQPDEPGRPGDDERRADRSPAAAPSPGDDTRDGTSTGDSEDAEAEERADGPTGDGLPLEAVLLDGETGILLGGGRVTYAHYGQPFQELRRDGAVHRLDALPGGDLVGRGVILHFRVEPPAGYSMENPEISTVSGIVSALARRLRIVLVAWPSATLLVRVEEQDGRPVAGATLTNVKVGDEGWEPDLLSNEAGEIRLPVPYLRGEPVSVQVSEGSRWWFASGRLRSRSKDNVIVIKLPPAEPEDEEEIPDPHEGTIGIGGGTGGGIIRRDEATGGGEAPSTGRLDVLVRRRTGAPARRALVRVRSIVGITLAYQRADEDGRLVLDGLPAGPVEIEIGEPGLLEVVTESGVEAGVTTEVALAEPEGITLLVVVQDHEGRPWPGVRLEVEPEKDPPWAALDGDVQILGLRTRSDGTRLLEGLPYGKIRIRARLGRSVATKVVEAGGRLEIVLRRR